MAGHLTRFRFQFGGRPPSEADLALNGAEIVNSHFARFVLESAVKRPFRRPSSQHILANKSDVYLSSSNLNNFGLRRYRSNAVLCRLTKRTSSQKDFPSRDWFIPTIEPFLASSLVEFLIFPVNGEGRDRQASWSPQFMSCKSCWKNLRGRRLDQRERLEVMGRPFLQVVISTKNLGDQRKCRLKILLCETVNLFDLFVFVYRKCLFVFFRDFPL